MVLSVENLSFGYNQKNILNKISFDVKKGETLAILGKNGAGKSTLLSLILGLFRQGIFAIPILIIMNSLVGLYGVVAAQLISDGCTFVIATLLYNKVYNSLQKEINTVKNN